LFYIHYTEKFKNISDFNSKLNNKEVVDFEIAIKDLKNWIFKNKNKVNLLILIDEYD